MKSCVDSVHGLAPARASLGKSAGGAFILKSGYTLGEYPVSVPDMLHRCAQRAPDSTWLAERPGAPVSTDPWNTVTYKAGLALVRNIGQGLLQLGARPDRPILALAANSIDFGLFIMAAMEAGIPIVPVTPAYGQKTANLPRLEHITRLIDPDFIFVDHGDAYPGSLRALDLGNVKIIAANPVNTDQTALDELKQTVPGPEIAAAFESLTPDSTAKIMFTSGSTGKQKGVITTHRMLCSNMAASARVWPFMDDHPTVILDWLPWSHSAGGNHNFDMPLYNAGTLYIDGGRPVPGQMDQTIANYRDISPTYVTNVPLGYAALVQALETDEAMARNFFRRLDILFYASASLPQNIWDRLATLASRYGAGDILILSGWGGTELAPAGTKAHWPLARAGLVGTPLPGSEVKLADAGGRRELRMKGPNVTPGYWNMPEKTREAFDEEGYYKSGDAGELVDPDRPELGLEFKGRIAENFKLATGAWVVVGELRPAVIAAAGQVVKDVVVAGHDQGEICLLVIPDLDRCRSLLGASAMNLAPAQLVRKPEIITALREDLQGYNRQYPHSSRRIARAIILDLPPHPESNEITDKGYVNQRAMLDNRAEQVAKLYTDPPGEDVIVINMDKQDIQD